MALDIMTEAKKSSWKNNNKYTTKAERQLKNAASESRRIDFEQNLQPHLGQMRLFRTDYENLLKKGYGYFGQDGGYDKAKAELDVGMEDLNSRMTEYYRGLDPTNPYYTAMHTDAMSTARRMKNNYSDSFKSVWDQGQADYDTAKKEAVKEQRKNTYVGAFGTSEDGTRQYKNDYDKRIAETDDASLTQEEKYWKEYLTAEDSESQKVALNKYLEYTANTNSKGDSADVEKRYTDAQKAYMEANGEYEAYIDENGTQDDDEELLMLERSMKAAEEELRQAKSERDAFQARRTNAQDTIYYIEGAQKLADLSDEAYDIVTDLAEYESSWAEDQGNEHAKADMAYAMSSGFSMTKSDAVNEYQKKDSAKRNKLKELGYSDKEIDELVKARVYQLDEGYMYDEMKKMQEFASEHKFWSSAASLGTNMISGAGYLNMVGQKIDRALSGGNTPINYNSQANKYSVDTSTIRGTVASGMSKTGGFVYQTFMSMADSGLNMAMAVALGAMGIPNASSLSTIIMSSSATTAATLQAHELGATDGQALWMGAIAGFAEYFTEKYSVEAILNKINFAGPGAAKRVAEYFLHNVATEGLEEVGSDLINGFADIMVMGDAGEWKEKLAEAKASGSDHPEMDVIWDFSKQAFLSFLGGALSGGVMGGIGGGIQYAGNANLQNMLNYSRLSGNENVQYAGTALEQILTEMQSVDQDSMTEAEQQAFSKRIAEARRNLSKQIASERKSDKTTHDTIIETIHETNAKGRELAEESRAQEKAFAKDKKAIGENLAATGTSDVLTEAISEFSEKGSLSSETLNKVRGDNAALAALGVNAKKSKVKMNSEIIAGLKQRQNTETKTEVKTEAQTETKAEVKAETAAESTEKTYGPAIIDVVKNYESTGVSSKMVEKIVGNSALREFFGIDDNLLQGASKAKTKAIVRDAVAATIQSQGLESSGMKANPSTVAGQKKQSVSYLAEKRARLNDSFDAFAEDFKTRNPDATDAQIREAFDKSVDAVVLLGARAYTQVGEEYHALDFSKFSEVMTEYGKKKGLTFTDVQLRQMFENAVNTTQEIGAAADNARFEKQKTKMESLAKTLNEKLADYKVDVEVLFGSDTFDGGENAFILINDKATGMSHIKINGDRVTSVEAMRRVLGHEIFHPAESIKKGGKTFAKNAAETFKTLNHQGKLDGYVFGKNTLLYDRRNHRGPSMSDLLSDYGGTIEKYVKAYGKKNPGFTAEEAEQEFMADCMNVVFGKNNTKLVRDITGYTPSFTERVYDVCRDFRALFGNTAAQQHKSVVKDLDRLCEDMRSALVENAKDNGSRFDDENVEALAEEGKALSVPNPEEARSSYTGYWTPTYKRAGMKYGIAKTKNGKPVFLSCRQVLFDELTKAGVSETVKNNILSNIDSIAEFMKQAGVEYRFLNLNEVNNATITVRKDENGKPSNIVFSAMLKNGEYPINFDFTSICKRRGAMSTFLNDLMSTNDMDELDLSKAQIMKINDILSSEGYDTACLGCFVEAKRFYMQDFANQFVETWNAAVDSVRKKAPYFDFASNHVLLASDEVADAIAVIESGGYKALNEKTAAINKEHLQRHIDELRKTGWTETAKKAVQASNATGHDEAEARLAVDPAAKGFDSNKYVSNKSLKKFESMAVGTKLTDAELDYLAEHRVFGTTSASIKEKIMNIVKSGEVFQKKLSYKDIMTTDGLAKLTELSPEVISLLQGSYGSGAPKLANGFVPYNCEIAYLPNKVSKIKLSDYIQSIAGVRFQSFSDFRIENIFDYVQMLADLTVRGLSAHTYTKEIACAEILGMCGVKVNMSLMFNIEGEDYWGSLEEAKKYAGMVKIDHTKPATDDNLTYNYADTFYAEKIQREIAEQLGLDIQHYVQSVDVDAAFELQNRPEYGKNIGTIAVGFSDYQVRRMMNDPNIRYIILYHSSGLPAEIKVLTNLHVVRDYQKDSNQNTMKILAIKDKNGKVLAAEESKKGIPTVKAFLSQLDTIGFADFLETVNAEGWTITTSTGEEVKDEKGATNHRKQKGHGDFDLYGDLAETGDPKRTANNYIAWCWKNQLLPLGYQFTNEEGYYKLLFDFSVYDENGEYAPQGAVHLWDEQGNLTGLPKNAFGKNGVVEKYMAEENDENRVLFGNAENRSEKYKETRARIEELVTKKSSITAEDSTGYAPAFYSKMENELSALKDGKYGAGAVVNMLRGKGVKAEEIKWSGIETFLQGKKSVSRQELLDFVKANQLQIEEQVLDNRRLEPGAEEIEAQKETRAALDSTIKQLTDKWNKLMPGTDIPDMGKSPIGAIRRAIFSYTDALEEKVIGKELISKYTSAKQNAGAIVKKHDNFGLGYSARALNALSGNFNNVDTSNLSSEEISSLKEFCSLDKAYNKKKEIVENMLYDVVQSEADLVGMAREMSRLQEEIEHPESLREKEALYATHWGKYSYFDGSDYKETLFTLPQADYSNSAMNAHWGKTVAKGKNVVAHARTQTVDTDSAGKMLFIEEIQSDWHNEKQKQELDRRNVKKYEKEIARREDLDPRYWRGELSSEEEAEYHAIDELLHKVFHGPMDLYSAFFLENEEDVPDVPFGDGKYIEFVMKNLLRKAAEGGFDSIGWTTADVHSERWGNDFAEGYRIEYDQQIPSFMKKYCKQWGATVELKPVMNEGKTAPVYVVNLTDEMKQSVLYKGQTRFSLTSQESVEADESGERLAVNMISFFSGGRTFDNEVMHRLGTNGTNITAGEKKFFETMATVEYDPKIASAAAINSDGEFIGSNTPIDVTKFEEEYGKQLAGKVIAAFHASPCCCSFSGLTHRWTQYQKAVGKFLQDYADKIAEAGLTTDASIADDAPGRWGQEKLKDLWNQYVKESTELDKKQKAAAKAAKDAGVEDTTARKTYFTDKQMDDITADYNTAHSTAEFILKHEPQVFTLENVAMYRGTPFFQEIREALVKKGYHFRIGIYNASDFGGAADRVRMFLVATKKGGVIPGTDQYKESSGGWYKKVEDMIGKQAIPVYAKGLPDSVKQYLDWAGIDPSHPGDWLFINCKGHNTTVKGEDGEDVKIRRFSASFGHDPAPTMIASATSYRIVSPDGTVYKATPTAIKKLMGLPDSMILPSDAVAKKAGIQGGDSLSYRILGNGISGELTDSIIVPMLQANLLEDNPYKTITENIDNQYLEAVAKKDMETATNLFRLYVLNTSGTNITPILYAKSYSGNAVQIAKDMKLFSKPGATAEEKARGLEAIKAAAEDMAKKIKDAGYDKPVTPNTSDKRETGYNKGAVLVPVPGHEGTAGYTLELARQIRKLTGIPVEDVLKGKPRQSFYELGDKRKDVSVSSLGIYQDRNLPDGKIPLFIDNDITTGKTGAAQLQAVGHGVVVAYAKSPRSSDATFHMKLAEAVTKDDDGNVIPLSQRFNPDNADKRYSLTENYGYHAGDLGKAEPFSKIRYDSGSTGHYGTGTYFVGNEEMVSKYGYGERPHEKVDFSKYHLFRPSDAKVAYDVHDFLRDIDLFWDYKGIKSEKDLNSIKEKYAELFDEAYSFGGEDLVYNEETKDWDWVETQEGFNAEKLGDAIRTAWVVLGDYRLQQLLDQCASYLPSDNFGSFRVSNGDISRYDFNTESFKNLTDQDIADIANQEDFRAGLLERALDDMDWSVGRQIRRYESFASDFSRTAQALFGISEKESADIINLVKESLNSDLKSGADMSVADTPGTRFMKALGYEGIDVRGIPDDRVSGLGSPDNFGYGSVIYDLKGEDLDRKKEIGTARFSLTDDTTATATETDEFSAFDSYDDFDARNQGFKTAREATNALIDERIAKYGRIGETGKNNARETKVPTKMKAKTNVSKSVETIMASGITPDFRIDDINDAIVGGKADYVSVKNKTLENRAKAKVRNIGFQKAAAQFIEASKQGKVNDDLVALGAVLLNNAGNSKECSGSEYIDILQAYVNISHRSAVALQAQNILKKLTPSGKLYAMQQEINKLNEERQKNGFDYASVGITKEQKAKHDAIVETDNKHVEWWMEDTGKILSKDLLGHVKTIMQTMDGTLGADISESKVQTVCQTVLDDLRLFAKEKMPEINRSMKHRSVMDRLRDLAANSEQYEEAWEQARQYLSLKLDLSDEDAAAAVSYVMDDALKVSDRLMEQISDKEGIKIDEDLARAFLMAETEKEQDAIMDEIAQKVADQIPVKFRDKLTAWRYLAMLGNFKTQIRNVVGNAGFKRVRQVKDIIAGALESQFAKDDRTTSAFRDTATLQDKDAQQACAEDMKYIMAGGTKYEYRSETEKYRSELGQKIKDKQRIFNNGILEFWRTRTDKAMSEGFTVNIAGKDRTFFGDEKFCRFTYMDSLARSMRAYGTTWANATEDQRNNARDRAILEAARATYRDNNQFAQAVSAIRFRNPDTTAKKFVNMLGEGILPFRKTPANILVRAIEYSPINALNGMTEAVLLKLGKNVDAEGNTKFTKSDVINTFAESITGTGIMAIGWALAAGLVPGLKLHGKSDDDDPLDAFNKMQGIQQYSIEFNGHTYTLDWLAPESIPLFLGANLAQASLEGGLSLQEAIDALMSITDPMLEMSMLQGINDAIQNASNYSDDAALPNLVANALWSMATQFVPTIVGQAERAVDNTRRSTYVDKNSAMPETWQRSLGKLSAKVPLWDYNQIAYTDAWGRTQNLQDSALGNGLYQFISPWYSTTVRESDMERELESLYESTGEGKILVETASKKISGVLEHPEDEKSGTYEKQLTAAEYTTYNVTRGQTAYNAITAFTESEDYNNLTDEQKVDVIKSLINFADTTGKIAATPYTYTNEKGEVVVTSAYPESKAYKKAREAMEAGMPLYQYYTAQAVGADCEYLVDSNGENIANSKDLYQMQAIYKAFPNASKEEYAQMFEAASISTSIRGYNANMVNSKITAMERYGSLSVLGATGIDAVDSELNRLTASDINTNVLMGSTSKTFKVSSNPNSKTATNDTEIELTDEQYEKYDTYRRETGAQLLNTMITSSQYRGLTDEQKAKAINAMESYVNASGKKLVMSSYVTDSTVDKVAAAKKQGISESTYFSVWAVKNGTDAKLYKTDGSVVTNSAGLYQMQAIYRSVPGLSRAQYTAMFEYIGIPKGVRGLTSSEVNAKLSKLVDKYGMNKG